MKEMRVVAIGVDQGRAVPVVLLWETSAQHRVLPVWVGLPEANAIELERHHVKTSRPSTHQLIAEVIEMCGRRLERVCVTKLDAQIFHAELVISPDLRVSARVSDAIALALHVDVPIEAAEAVLDEAALTEAAVIDIDASRADDVGPVGEIDERTVLERMRRFLNQANPEDFDVD